MTAKNEKKPIPFMSKEFLSGVHFQNQSQEQKSTPDMKVNPDTIRGSLSPNNDMLEMEYPQNSNNDIDLMTKEEFEAKKKELE